MAFDFLCSCWNSTKCVKFLAKLLGFLSLLLSIVAIIGYSYDLYRHGKQKHLIGWFSSGGFVVLTFLISIRLIIMHLLNWRMPNIQKYIVRILWMVPLYSIESWLALRFRTMAIYIETFRECYEAYVIYNFLQYIIALLGEETQLVAILKNKETSRGKHVFPFNFCFWSNYWIPGSELLNKCKIGVLQYVLIKNLMAIIVFILESCHVYDEGHFHWNKGYMYTSAINFISQSIALYCLVYFYNITKEDLAPFKPLGKFLTVKMVVFFTWWQSILISIIVSKQPNNFASSDIPDSWTGEEISKGFQDFVICIEMFIASLAFTYTFSYRDFVVNSHTSITPRKQKHEENEELHSLIDGAAEDVSNSSSSSSGVVGNRSHLLKHTVSSMGSPASIGNKLNMSVGRNEKETGVLALEDGIELMHTDSGMGVPVGMQTNAMMEHANTGSLPGSNSNSFYQSRVTDSTPTEPFLFAFMQSSFPRDIWEEIQKVAVPQVEVVAELAEPKEDNTAVLVVAAREDTSANSSTPPGPVQPMVSSVAIEV